MPVPRGLRPEMTFGRTPAALPVQVSAAVVAVQVGSVIHLAERAALEMAGTASARSAAIVMTSLGMVFLPSRREWQPPKVGSRDLVATKPAARACMSGCCPHSAQRTTAAAANPLSS
jgi:hypothetical protein